MTDGAAADGLSTSIELGVYERATFEALTRLDAQLAAFFQMGHELSRQTGPAKVNMLAHAGRELSRGVIGALTGEEDDLSRDRRANRECTSEEGQADPKQRSRNRARIAAALELPEVHQTVGQWFDAVSVFSRSAHFSEIPKDQDEVREAFARLSQLLYARLAPFFDAFDQTARLAELSDPSPTDADLATQLLARPQLRRPFFQALQSPKWISLLAERGHFDHQPERVIELDGSWRMQAWPEGDYLARMAVKAPAAAIEQLGRVSAGNSNPLVWGALVDAAMVVRVAESELITKKVIAALRVVPPFHLPYKCIALLVHLATANADDAFDLLGALIWLRGEAERHALLARARDQRPLFAMSGRSTEWVLARVELDELQEIIRRALPLLLRATPMKAFTMLVKTMDRALLLLREDEADLADWKSSHIWCPDLSTADDQDDVRAVLLAATMRAAIAAAEQSDSNARDVVAAFATRKGVIWQRMSWHLVGHAESFVSEFAETLIGSADLLESPFGLREAGQILRKCFESVSPNARASFATALTAGPAADVIEWMMSADREFRPTDAEGLEISDADRERTVRGNWQLRRLRLFHDKLPAELSDLAESLGHRAIVPDLEDQATDEGRVYSTGASSWGGPPSPITVEEMVASDPEALLNQLVTWRPEAGSYSAREQFWSLNSALTQFAAQHVAAALLLVETAIGTQEARFDPVPLLNGFRDATNGLNPPLDCWDSLISTVEYYSHESCLEEYERVAPQRVSRLAKAVIALLQQACATNSIPSTHAVRVRAVVTELLSSKLVHEELIPSGADSHGNVRHARNSLSGDLVRLLVNAGLWDYRSRRHGSKAWTGADEEVTKWTRPLLERLCEVSTQRDDAISITLALHVEGARMLAPDWMEAEYARLFRSEDDAINPAARAMVETTEPSPRGLVNARPILVQLAELSEPSDETADPDASFGSALLWWGALGFLWRLWGREEPDRVFEACFRAATAKERRKLYWQIFATLSGSKNPDAEFTARVAELWRWRLTELEHIEDQAQRAAEAEGLLWLLKAPHLDPTVTVELGMKNLEFGPFGDRLSTSAWDRVGVLMRAIPVPGFDLLEKLLEAQLNTRHGYLPFEAVAPSLRIALGVADPDVQRRATDIIHRLGDNDHLEFGQLLRE